MLVSQYRYVVVALGIATLLWLGQTASATTITVNDSSFEGLATTGYVSGAHWCRHPWSVVDKAAMSESRLPGLPLPTTGLYQTESTWQSWRGFLAQMP